MSSTKAPPLPSKSTQTQESRKSAQPAKRTGASGGKATEAYPGGSVSGTYWRQQAALRRRVTGAVFPVLQPCAAVLVQRVSKKTASVWACAGCI